MTERERLIELLEDVSCTQYKGDIIVHSEMDIDNEEINRIADYLLANGVVVPLCNVGDKLYNICTTPWLYGVIEYTVDAIQIHTYGGEIYYASTKVSKERFFKEDVGQTVFFKKEEAEKALEEMSK